MFFLIFASSNEQHWNRIETKRRTSVFNPTSRKSFAVSESSRRNTIANNSIGKYVDEGILNQAYEEYISNLSKDVVPKRDNSLYPDIKNHTDD